ncbi:MAG TPA: hypothetical protein VHX42_02465 [Candidatus Babeliales bacterium]|jgi:hypothetical protein|nr:hypothetical protein [Candidatus Babeliales bacterium]
MLNVSKKLFLLPIIFFITAHTQCSENVQSVKITGGTLQLDASPKDDSIQNNSALLNLGRFLAPYAIPAILTYIIQKYNEDPGVAAINKEIKKIELETKQHPDYSIISLQLKKNKAEEKNLINTEKRLELEIKNAQLMQHYEDKLDQFRTCDKPLTQAYCDSMSKIYQRKLEESIQQRS